MNQLDFWHKDIDLKNMVSKVLVELGQKCSHPIG